MELEQDQKKEISASGSDVDSWREHCSHSNEERISSKLKYRNFSWVHQKAKIVIQPNDSNSEEQLAPTTG